MKAVIKFLLPILTSEKARKLEAAGVAAIVGAIYKWAVN